MYKRLIRFLVTERLYHFVFGFQSGTQWCRIVMNQATETMIKDLPYSSLSVLEISGTKWANFGFKNYRTVEFPDFDICADTLPEKYDLIIAEQVFEHILWPYRAAKNVNSMLNQNGHFLITTPFMIKIHLYPEDCTRWTETGLKHFLAESGFELDQVLTGSWGNIECVVSNINQWTSYNRYLHSLKNDKNVPMVVWGLAKKT